jgi:hypothetical protein
MATYTASNLLTLFNTYAGRPESGDAISDATKYDYLTRAQDVVIADFASRIPEPLYSHVAYGSTPTLTALDSTNQVFFFSSSNVNGDYEFPIGKANIYDSLSAIPDNPLVEGQDYLWEGAYIRIPSNRSHSGTLYWRGVAAAAVLSSSGSTLTLSPPPARVLVVYEAVRQFATTEVRNPELAQSMASEYGLSFARWCLTYKTAVVTKGAGGVSGLRLAMLRA